MGPVSLVGVDVAIFVDALVKDAPGHADAREAITMIGSGLSDFGVVAPAAVSLWETLIRLGGSDEWVTHRVDDLVGMCRLLEVSGEDVAAGMELTEASGLALRVAVTGFALARHGATAVLAFDPGFAEIPGLRMVRPDALNEIYA